MKKSLKLLLLTVLAFVTVYTVAQNVSQMRAKMLRSAAPSAEQVAKRKAVKEHKQPQYKIKQIKPSKVALNKRTIKNAAKVKAAKPKKSLYEKAQEWNQKKASKTGFKAIVRSIQGKKYMEYVPLPQQNGMRPAQAQK